MELKHKFFFIKKKWLAGRNSNNGRIILWTKKKLNKKIKYPLINYYFRYNKLGVISSFQFLQFSNKMITLVIYSNGSASYYLSTENFFLFDYFYLNLQYKIKRYKFKLYWTILLFLKKLSFVSCLEILPQKKSQYMLSNGTKGKIFAINNASKTALIILPSKLKKNFSLFSVCLFGAISLFEKKKFSNTKSGYWRNLGKKSIVRGVAMNPVDHPHGGRTKAIKHQRTPWGKTTKLK